MPPWLVVVLYFGCIALIIGGMYGIYRLLGGSENKPVEKPKTVTVEEADGTRKNVVSGEEAYDKDGYTLKEGDRDQLFQELLDANTPYSIEPGVSLQSCEEVLQLCAEYPGRIFPAVGIHPTRSIYEKWSDRKKLDAFAKTPGVIAIGECGLDYHYKREEQHRLKQHIWFLYQLDLAWRLKKPVILHVRDAHEDALRILRWHPARKLGGVIHCFYGSWEIALQYLKLGYHFGIGGSILQ